jgi:general secretion pathway protein D
MTLLDRFSVPRCLLAISIFVTVHLIPASGYAQDQVLNLRDADIRAFIDDVSMLTGRSFIVDPRVTGQVTVISREPIDPDTVFQVFLSTLRVNGFTAVPTASGAYKIVPDDSAADNFTPVGRDSRTGDQVVTEVFTLHHIDTTTALNTIRPIASQKGRVIATPGTRAIIVVDFADNMARIQNVLAELDRDMETIVPVQLLNTSATEMAKIVMGLAGTQRGEDGARPNVTAIPVERSNTLLLKGDPLVIERMLQVVSELDDGNQAKEDVRVVYLKHAAGEELVPMLEAISASLSRSANPDEGSRTSITYHRGTNALVISADPDMQQALDGVIRQLDVARAQVLVEAIIVEVSDVAARELGLQYILSGSRGSEVPFTVANYSSTAPNILALTGAVVADRESSGEDSQVIEQLQTQALNSLLGLNGFAIGGAGITEGGTLFGVILNAVDQDVGSNVLSTPSIMTMDNEAASIIVGQEIPITTGEVLGSSNTNPFRQIERQDVGIQLEVRPQINDGDTIKLFIRQEVSSVFGPVSDGFSELVTNKREIETTVMVDDGEIIVLGGLIEDDRQSTVDKIPILGDVPVIGRAFRSEGRSKEKTNLMVFIRPTILRNVDDVRSVTSEKYNYMRAEQALKSRDGTTSMDSILGEVMGVSVPASGSSR